MNIVEQIHNEIDTAQDRLLKEAVRTIEETKITETTKVESKASRLERLGFTSTPATKIADKARDDRSAKERLIQFSKENASLIRYYKREYPFHKFLTEEELERICDKYSLIFAPVNNYIKDIPEKNLQDMETMKKIKERDELEPSYKFEGRRCNAFWGALGYKDATIYFSDFIKEVVKAYGNAPDDWGDPVKSTTGTYVIEEKLLDSGRNVSREFDTLHVIDKTGLFIAAPKTHFNLDKLQEEGKHGFFKVLKVEPKDPIVFQHVKGGILVITKWGDEAEDELLVNEINN